MTKPAPVPLHALLSRAHSSVFGSHRKMGEVAHASRNTVAHWVWGKSRPGQAQIARIARHVHPKDRELASLLAEAAGESLVSLGLEGSPAPRPAPSAQHLANGVLCAASEAGDLPPKALRPVLVVAFRAAQAAGLGVEDVLRGLEEPAKERAARR